MTQAVRETQKEHVWSMKVIRRELRTDHPAYQVFLPLRPSYFGLIEMPVESRGSTLLDPTWKRVASFNEAGPSDWQSTDAAGQDGQWEYEDEEELVTLDLGPDSKRLVQMSQEYSIAVR